MTLGEQIKQAREAKNYSQEELANILGVSRQAISKWENGIAEPHGVNREMLNQTLELNIALEDDDIKQELFGMKKKIVYRNTALLVLLCICVILAVLLIISCKKKPKAEQPNLPSPGENVELPENGEGSKPGGDTNTATMFVPRGTNFIESIIFYDSEANVVPSNALWYNMANIDYMVVSWSGDIPQTVDIFLTPTGTNTTEQKELVLTKAITQENRSVLIDLSILKREDLMAHMSVMLNYGDTATSISSEMNVMYDENEVYDPDYTIDFFEAFITSVSEETITVDRVNWVHLNGATAEGKETVEGRYYTENDEVVEETYEFDDLCMFQIVDHGDGSEGPKEVLQVSKEDFINTVNGYMYEGKQYAFFVSIHNGKVHDVSER